jgi:MFS family permease
MDRWGRKAGIIYCAVFSLIGGALLCGAQNVGMFIAARFIAGWGSWGFLAVSTYMYQPSDMKSPPDNKQHLLTPPS